MRINIKVYDKCKYLEDSKVIAEVVLSGITNVKVKEIPLFERLNETVVSCVDEYNKYLILTFENGETSTYRHCHVDAFRVD